MSELSINPVSEDEPRAPGPIEAGFHLVLERVKELSAAGLLDEETLTSCLFGGLAVALPLMVERYGSGVDKPQNVSWGPYNKAGRVSNDDSEAASGADFTLVLWESETRARIAVFQAKKGEWSKASSSWSVNVHRKPRPPSTRRPQLVMLAATGLRLTRELKREPLCRDEAIRMLDNASSDSRKKQLSDFRWIHYLAYLNSVPVCVSLGDLEAKTIDKEFASDANKQNLVEVSTDWPVFYSLIQAGLSKDPGKAWLPVDKDTLQLLLPDLLDLMPVYVAGDRGGGFENIPANVVDGHQVVPADASSVEQMDALRQVAGTKPRQHRSPRP